MRFETTKKKKKREFLFKIVIRLSVCTTRCCVRDKYMNTLRVRLSIKRTKTKLQQCNFFTLTTILLFLQVQNSLSAINVYCRLSSDRVKTFHLFFISFNFSESDQRGGKTLSKTQQYQHLSRQYAHTWKVTEKLRMLLETQRAIGKKAEAVTLGSCVCVDIHIHKESGDGIHVYSVPS